jgi:hypothetical protein
MGDELREFVKSFLANLDVDNPVFEIAQSASQVETLETDTFEWFKALRWCPRELLDLVNSKACRGTCLFGSYARTRSDVKGQEPSCSMTRSHWTDASGWCESYQRLRCHFSAPMDALRSCPWGTLKRLAVIACDPRRAE